MLLWLGFGLCAGLGAAEYNINLNLTDAGLKAYRYAPAFSGQGPIAIATTAGWRQYYYYVPVGADIHSPVLILLHGAGRDGRSMIDTWKGVADQHRIRLLAPNGERHNWSMQAAREGNLLQQILRAVYPDMAGKPVYLFGHSNGARMALRLVAAYPQAFAAVAVHGGTEPGLTLPARAQRLPALALFLGDRDAIFSVASGRTTVGRFEEAGFAASLYVLQNHTHWYYSDAQRINKSIWAFLARQLPR